MEQKQLGIGLLMIGIIGVVLVMMMDTSVVSGYGRVNNLGLMNDQKNYLIIAGLAVIAGLVLVVMGGGESSSSSALRACPSCAEQIQALAVKCRFCGTEVEPLQAGSNIGSVDGLSDADLKNLAEFYSIREVGGEYELQGQRYPSIAEAVRAARAVS